MKQYGINHVEEAVNRIGELIKAGHRRFVLFPFGEQGRLAKCVLNCCYGIEEIMIVDGYLEWDGVKRLDDITGDILRDAIVLITSDRPDVHQELLDALFKVCPKEKCFELFPGSVEKQIEAKKKESEECEQIKEKVIEKLDETKLEEKGMCYSIRNGQSTFFLPYVYMDLIQQTIFLYDDYFESGLLQKIFYETDDKYLRESSFFEDGCVLDIGANIGNHTIYFANELHAKKIIAFEPIKETFRILKKNIALNKLEDVVELHNIGLSDEKGKAAIGGTYHYENIGGTGLRTGEGSLKLETIDDMDISQVIFIKIDVEGMELRVLKGAEKTIKRDMPYIMIESFPNRYESIQSYLKSLGYGKWYDYGIADHLFIPTR